jgi:hypothetical protein
MVADETPAEEPVKSRFADEMATEIVDLGDGESAVVRTSIGDGEIRSVFYSAQRVEIDGTLRVDEVAVDDACGARFTLSWTLKDHDGNVAPITAHMISLLDQETRNRLLVPINAAIQRSRARAIPNPSSASSRASSRGSASRIRKIRTQR